MNILQYVEQHLIEVCSFAVYLLTLGLGIWFMKHVDDNNIARRLILILGLVMVYFNPQISNGLYMGIRATIELVYFLCGLGLVMGLAVSVVATLIALPVAALFRWLTRAQIGGAE